MSIGRASGPGCEPSEGAGPSRDPDSRLTRAALKWQVLMLSGEVSPAQQRAFQAWLDRDPRHAKVWHQLEAVAGQWRSLPASVGQTVLGAGREDGSGGRGARSRRRTVLGAFALSALGAGAVAVHRSGDSSWWLADLRTTRGEWREERLVDGTRIVLNTATAINLRFSASERRLILLGGEVLIETAPDPQPVQRPFVVETREGWIRPIGTRFAVRRVTDTQTPHARVQVLEGQVELIPGSRRAPVHLLAGEAASVDAEQVTDRSNAAPDTLAWSRGLLMAEGMRLDRFIAELGRYRRGVLICDPEVAGLRVSGVFPLADTEAVLDILGHGLPVRVRRNTRFWVRISPA